MRDLDRETILAALRRLSELLGERGLRGELCLFGGALMVLAYGARPRTKDIDAVFAPAAEVRALAEVIRQEMNLPEAWLNDGAKGFLSAAGDLTESDLPQFAHLHLCAPTAEYLLAMKCLASRTGIGSEVGGDVADIALLIKRLGLESPASVLDVVGRYYPPERIPVRAQFLLEEIFARIRGES